MGNGGEAGARLRVGIITTTHRIRQQPASVYNYPQRGGRTTGRGRGAHGGNHLIKDRPPARQDSSVSAGMTLKKKKKKSM